MVTGEFSMDEVMKFVECMPDEILPLYRRQRSYVNSILSGNEIDRDSSSNKKLFKRTKRGCYILNPFLIYKSDAE
jgi:hypothetical protein